MKVGSVTKQPGERISVSIAYDEALDEGDEITQIDACVVTPGGELTAAPVLATERRARVWLEGGTDAITYKVTVTVSTAGGERLEDEITVKVKEI